jgi:signal transduction histidine kinase
VKYSPADGAIDVVATYIEGAVVVVVSDTGPGIAPEYRERVFDRFFRVEPPGMNVGGAGLGLAICRRFVELHGGTLELDPAQRRGASFRFTLPVATEPIAAEGAS